MIEVTKDKFFSAVGGPEDIHPSALVDCSVWKNARTDEIVGKSEPGYASPHGTPKKYFLTTSFAMAKGISAQRTEEAK